MYNIGFGDCFLLQIPTDSGPKRIVIDCGSLKNKHYNIKQISNRLIMPTGMPIIFLASLMRKGPASKLA